MSSCELVNAVNISVSEVLLFKSTGSSSESASSKLDRLVELVLLLGPDEMPSEVRFPRLESVFALVANVANNSATVASVVV